MWNEIATLFREYMGSGLIMILYLLSLIYLYIKEEKKYIRIIFVTAPVCLLLLYFNPIFAEVFYRLAGNEVYYRILWLIPVTVVIAYTVCHIYGNLPKNRKTVFLICTVGIIIFSGKLVYKNPHFSEAENAYHVPDSVVRICDEIVIPGREIMAVFPSELIQYVRQYSALVCMPYGREVLVERWGFENELERAMESRPVDAKKLVALATAEGCHYIILREEQTIPGDPRDYGLEIQLVTDGYVVYRNTQKSFAY